MLAAAGGVVVTPDGEPVIYGHERRFPRSRFHRLGRRIGTGQP